MNASEMLFTLAEKQGFASTDVEAVAAFVRRELENGNFFQIDANPALGALATWDASPEAAILRAERAAREAAAFAALNSPE
jgi:hypothetical protein